MGNVCEKATLFVPALLDLTVGLFQCLEHAVDGNCEPANLVPTTRAPDPPSVVVTVGYIRGRVRQPCQGTHRAPHPEPRHESHQRERQDGPRNEHASPPAKNLIERTGRPSHHDIPLELPAVPAPPRPASAPFPHGAAGGVESA